MSVLTRNNIVTNGLVLYLDAKNPQSIPIDPTVNLKAFSQDYTSSGANYNFDNITATSSFIAPDGTLTTTLFTETTASGVHRLTVTDTSLLGLQQNKYYTLSFHIKNNGRPIGDSFFEFPSGRLGVTYNLSNGTVANYGSNAVYTCSITPVDNGYYRISYTGRETASLAGGFGLTLFRTFNESGSGNYTGNGLSGSYFWGLQVEQNIYTTPYTASVGNNLGKRTTWGDLSGNNNFATLSTGSITSSLPQYNYLNQHVLNFDGTGSYAFISSSWSYLSSSAIETVFSVNSFQSSEVTSIGGYDQNSTSTFGRSVAGMIYLQNNNKQIEASVITLTQTYRTVTSTTIVNTGSYYHVVLNKDTTAGTLQLYVNGRLESTNTFDTGSYAQWFSTGSFQGSNVIQISNTISTNLASWIGGKYLNGKIPLFKLYNRTLTQNEILQNYNAIKTRFGLT